VSQDLVELRRGDHSSARLRIEQTRLEFERRKVEAFDDSQVARWAKDPRVLALVNEDSGLSDEERRRRIAQIYGRDPDAPRFQPVAVSQSNPVQPSPTTFPEDDPELEDEDAAPAPQPAKPAADCPAAPDARSDARPVAPALTSAPAPAVPATAIPPTDDDDAPELPEEAQYRAEDEFDDEPIPPVSEAGPQGLLPPAAVQPASSAPRSSGHVGGQPRVDFGASPVRSGSVGGMPYVDFMRGSGPARSDRPQRVGIPPADPAPPGASNRTPGCSP
jgi:hypothetical protein